MTNTTTPITVGMRVKHHWTHAPGITTRVQERSFGAPHFSGDMAGQWFGVRFDDGFECMVPECELLPEDDGVDLFALARVAMRPGASNQAFHAFTAACDEAGADPSEVIRAARAEVAS